MERQRFLHAFVQTAGGGHIHLRELRDEAGERALRFGIGGVGTRRLELPPPEHVGALEEIAQHALALVLLAPLHGRVVPKDVAHGGAEALRAVEHDEQVMRGRKAALVFSVAVWTRPRIRFLPRPRHGKRNEELIAGEAFPVEEQHEPLAILQSTPLQRLERPRTALDEPARHTRLREAECFRHRLRCALIIAAGHGHSARAERGRRPIVRGVWSA